MKSEVFKKSSTLLVVMIAFSAFQVTATTSVYSQNVEVNGDKKPPAKVLTAERLNEMIGYLGCGYNTTGKYAVPGGFKPRVVGFDLELAKKSVRHVNQFTSTTSSGSSISKYYSDLNLSASAKGSYGSFSGEFEARFGKEKTQEHQYTFVSHEEYMEYLSITLPDTHEAVNSFLVEAANKSISPKEIFDKFGSHYVRKAIIGGRITTSASVRKDKLDEDTDIEASMKMAYASIASGSASADSKSSSLTQTLTSKATIAVSGGSPEFGTLIETRAGDPGKNYSDWSHSVAADPEVVRFPADGLVPIWTLVANRERAKQLEDYYNETYLKSGDAIEIGGDKLTAGKPYYLKLGLDGKWVSRPIWSGPNSRLTFTGEKSAAVQFTFEHVDTSKGPSIAPGDELKIKLSNKAFLAEGYEDKGSYLFMGDSNNVFLDQKSTSNSSWQVMAATSEKTISSDLKIQIYNKGYRKYMRTDGDNWVNGTDDPIQGGWVFLSNPE